MSATRTVGRVRYTDDWGAVDMHIARVVGLVVSTIKHSGLQGRSLLVLEPTSLDDLGAGGEARRSPGATAYVATDHVGAGVGELVLVTMGGAARVQDDTAVPADAAVIAILDTVVVENKAVFNKNG